MKAFKIFFIGIILFLADFEDIICCDGRVRIPVKPDSTEVIFLGEVIKVVGPLNKEQLSEFSLTNKWWGGQLPSEYLADNVYGLRLKVIREIQLPKNLNDTLDIIPYSTRSDCAPKPYKYELLNTKYIPGTMVVVIAKKPKFVKFENNNNIPRLEAWYWNGGFMLESLVNPSYFEKIANRINYNKHNDFVYLEERNFLNPDYSGKKLWGHSYLSHVELRRDLQRLDLSNIKEIKELLLRRILNYIWYSVSEYSELLNNYLDDQDLISELLKKKKKIKNVN